MSGYVFISYSRTDIAYVVRLMAQLRGTGLEVWNDDQVKFGDTWPRVIEQRLCGASVVVVVTTPAAAASEWVHREVAAALQRRTPILPILLTDKPLFALATHKHEVILDGGLPSREFVAQVAAQARQRPGPDRLSPNDAPPAADRPPATRSRPVEAAVGVLVLIVLLVVAASMGPHSPAPKGPKEVVEQYLAAFKNGDLNTMRSLLCAPDQSKVESFAASLSQIASHNADVTFDVTSVSVTGDTATATVSYAVHTPNQRLTSTLATPVIRESDGWKVCTAV